jgi:hypothetical protein
MKPKILLRVAAIIMLLHTTGHTMGTLGWKKGPNATIQTVIDNMQKNDFIFMGRTVSLGKFYSGYGFVLIGVLLLIGILLWVLSTQTGTASSKQILLPVTGFLFFLGVAEWIYFFPFAALFSLSACILSAIAMVRMRYIKTQVP